MLRHALVKDGVVQNVILLADQATLEPLPEAPADFTLKLPVAPEPLNLTAPTAPQTHVNEESYKEDHAVYQEQVNEYETAVAGYNAKFLAYQAENNAFQAAHSQHLAAHEAHRVKLGVAMRHRYKTEPGVKLVRSDTLNIGDKVK